LAKDKESQSFLGEAQELTQRLDADRESQRDNRAYGSFDTQLQELVAQFILLRREERPRLRSQFELLRAESLAHRPLRESYRQPTFVSVDQDAHQAIVLQIGAGPTVPLASLRPEIAGGPVKLPGAWSDYAGQTLLVDVRTLDFQRYQELVGALVTARQQGLKVNFCFQRSPQSQAHFQVFPDWLSVRVLGDSTHFKTFPAHVRQISVDWLHELASAWDSVQKQDLKSNRAEFVVDHFDQEGHSLQALKQRIQRGDLRAAYALALLGDSKRESLQAFLELADLAVREGQAEMFSFPIEALPAPVAPLVVDAMLDSFRTPVATPLELPTRACQDVRRRLERCLLEHDPAAMQEALRSALPSRTKRDPVDLFRDRSGEFQPKVLKEMIEVLRRTEQGFITVTVNELASPTHFRC
jgi:hypothetical protein